MRPTLRAGLQLSTLLVGFHSWVSGQEPPPGIPAPTNIRGAEHPRIHPDLRVTFRVKAPDADPAPHAPARGRRSGDEGRPGPRGPA